MTSKQIKLIETYIRKVVRKTLNEQTWKGHPAVTGGDDDPEFDLNSSDIHSKSKYWKIQIGKSYQWKDSEGEFPGCSVKCLGFSSDGRLAYFECLNGQFKGSYIQLDALMHGKELK